MINWIPVALTVFAMLLDILSMAFIIWITSRTKGRMKTSFILLMLTALVLLFRRTLNLLNLSSIFQSELVENSLAALTALLLFTAIVNFFRSIREVTDVKVEHYRKEEHLPPPKHQSTKRWV